jgi:MSHA type pilus biogenesis protein MshL
VPIEPEIPGFNPLEETPVSISVKDEPLHDVLYVIARNAGLNLVIEPGISLENKVTLSFEDTPSSVVVEKLLQAYDLAWEIKDNVLFVKRFEERTFDLGFLNVQTAVEIDNGGDVFGSALGEGSANMAGKFQVTASLGKGIADGSLYSFVQTSIASILAGGGSAGSSTAGASSGDQYFTLDPLAGTLVVRASPQKMNAVSRFLRQLKKKMKKQIIIDAQILEVSLKDDFRFGIDWNYVAERLISGTAYSVNVGWTGAGAGTIPLTVVTKPDSAIGSHDRTSTMRTTIEALQTFGNVKVVSNPHVRARHGQPALFTSGTSENYVRSVTRQEEDGQVTYTVDVASVFDGILLGVVPFINNENEADLQIFPIKSQVDPDSLTLRDVTGDGSKITLPKIEIKNVSTNVKVHNNDTIILGGLIDKTTGKTDQEVPGLGRIPVLGWLFKGKNYTEQVRELVIIMTIRII